MRLFLSGIVVFASFTLEAITGFGCTVIALPFVTALLGMEQGVPILTVLALLLAMWIALRNLKSVNFKILAVILAFMLPFLPVGIRLKSVFNARILKLILAVFIVSVSGARLAAMLLRKKAERKAKVKWYSYIALALAGVVHGMFSSGGPLAIVYTANALPEKKQFRATLCALWTTLNCVLVATYFVNGTFTAQMGLRLAALLPFMLAGIVVGDKINDKVNDRVFTILVYASLFVTGVFMLV